MLVKAQPCGLHSVSGEGMVYTDRMVRYAGKEEWLASRVDHIGASEIAACLGLSTFADASPFRVWQSKVDPDGADQMTAERQNDLNRGNRAEGAILGEFGDSHPELIIKPTQFVSISHPVYEHIRCTPDALAWKHGDLENLAEQSNPHAVIDAKFVEVYSKKHYGESGSDNMPYDYLIQGLILCECLEVEKCHFAVWIGRWDYREFVVRRNEKVAEGLIQRTLDWMGKYVTMKIHPPLDDSPQALAFVKAMFPKVERDVLKVPSPEIIEIARNRDEAAAMEKQWAGKKSRCQAQLLDYIGDSAGIADVCTYKDTKPRVSLAGLVKDLAGYVDPTVMQQLTANNTPASGSRTYRSKLEPEG